MKSPNKGRGRKEQRYGRAYAGTKAETPDTDKATPVADATKAQPLAEEMEGRGLAKGNLRQQNAPRTPSREGAPSALERVRQAAKRNREMRFTALLHHVYEDETLRSAYHSLKREAAPGVDGETWRHYGEALEENLQDLAARLKRGAYRAKPVRRVYIAKADGRQRPLGVPAPALRAFRFQVGRLWRRALSRRSQHGRVRWDRMLRLIARWLPPARTYHPYPLRRLGVIT